jgi:hypothetical protein
MPHPRVCRADASQSIFAAAANDDLVSKLVKRFREPFSDARCPARNKNRVGLHFHEIVPYNP